MFESPLLSNALCIAFITIHRSDCRILYRSRDIGCHRIRSCSACVSFRSMSHHLRLDTRACNSLPLSLLFLTSCRASPPASRFSSHSASSSRLQVNFPSLSRRLPRSPCVCLCIHLSSVLRRRRALLASALRFPPLHQLEPLLLSCCRSRDKLVRWISRRFELQTALFFLEKATSAM